MDIATFIILYGIDEDLSVLTSFDDLGVYPMKSTGHPLETSLLTVFNAGDDDILALLWVITDPVLVIISDVG